MSPAPPSACACAPDTTTLAKSATIAPHPLPLEQNLVDVHIGQETRHIRREQPHKSRVHEFAIVGNVEADDARVAEMALELGGELVPMRLLHHKDEFGPRDEILGDGVVRVMV